MPKITYRGKFDGNWDALPFGGDKPGAVEFKEMDIKKAPIFYSIVAAVLFIIVLVIFNIAYGFEWFSIIGFILTIPALVVHEYLHAICMKDQAYIYQAVNKGILFATTPESIPKGRFIFMSLLPNLVLGLIPLVIFIANPSLGILGTFGLCMLVGGTGDYINVIHTITQVPSGALIYLKGEKTLWYRPTDTAEA